MVACVHKRELETVTRPYNSQWSVWCWVEPRACMHPQALLGSLNGETLRLCWYLKTWSICIWAPCVVEASIKGVSSHMQWGHVCWCGTYCPDTATHPWHLSEAFCSLLRTSSQSLWEDRRSSTEMQLCGLDIAHQVSQAHESSPKLIVS